MYDNLKAIGVTQTDRIEKYSIRTESDHDILKIYYQKNKGELFARSEKFKYPRQHKKVQVDSGTHTFQNVSEIAPTLRYVVEELDKICKQETEVLDAKQKILKDLRHLEKVVQNKISEIETQLEKL